MHAGHPTSGDLVELSQALGADSFDLAGGRVHLLQRFLPEGFPAAVVVEGGEMWVVVDCAQPCARRHAWALVSERILEMADRDHRGTVLQLVPQPRSSDAAHLTLVS